MCSTYREVRFIRNPSYRELTVYVYLYIYIYIGINHEQCSNKCYVDTFKWNYKLKLLYCILFYITLYMDARDAIHCIQYNNIAIYSCR